MGLASRVELCAATLVVALGTTATPTDAAAQAAPEEAGQPEGQSPPAQPEAQPPEAQPPEAQQPEASASDGDARTHNGFYMRMGLGIGYVRSKADGGGEVKGPSLPHSFFLGGSPIPGLVLGGGYQGDYVFKPDPDALKWGLLLGVGGFVDFYPWPEEGLHFQAFVGWGGLESKAKGGTAGGSDPTGAVISFGGGYDIWIGDEWSFGGVFRFTYGALKLNNVKFKTIAPSVLATITFN